MWNLFGIVNLRPWVVANGCASDGLYVVVVLALEKREREKKIDEA